MLNTVRVLSFLIFRAEVDLENGAVQLKTRPSADRRSTNSATPQEVDTSLVRLNVNLTQESAAFLRAAAAAKGISYTDAVRRALAITAFLDEQIEAGRMIQAVGADGTIRELVFL